MKNLWITETWFKLLCVEINHIYNNVLHVTKDLVVEIKRILLFFTNLKIYFFNNI